MHRPASKNGSSLVEGTVEESNLVAAFKSSNPLPEIAARAAVARQRREPVDHQ
jgi:hypothetical protein